MSIYPFLNDLQNQLFNQNQWLVAAESCTGGLISHLITEIPGSSRYFLGGVVCYANEIKNRIVGVSTNTIETYGAVSQQTVAEMASGIRMRFSSPIHPIHNIVAVAVTGIAGPEGGTEEKPVGTVWIGVESQHGCVYRHFLWDGNRQENKQLSAEMALHMVLDHVMEK